MAIVLNGTGVGTFTDASGNAGVGTATPNVTGWGRSVTLNAPASGNAAFEITENGTLRGYMSSSVSDGINLYAHTGQNLRLGANNTKYAEIDTSGNLKFDSGYGSTGTAYGCRAWVNFNGTGSVSVRGSGNVSSITDGGTGIYTINFTNNMPDTNYAVVAMCEPSNVPGVGATFYTIIGADNSNAFTRTVSGAQIKTAYVSSTSGAGTLWDSQGTHVAIFR